MLRVKRVITCSRRNFMACFNRFGQDMLNCDLRFANLDFPMEKFCIKDLKQSEQAEDCQECWCNMMIRNEINQSVIKQIDPECK